MSQVSSELVGQTLVVRFTNPPHGYMDAATVPELEPVVSRAETDEAVHCVVFTGGLPGVFIRHYSVQELEQLSDNLVQRGFEADTTAPGPESPLHQVFRRVQELPKPTIAAINGTAMGGGFEFALCCDIRIAEDGPYSLGLPEINVGILPGAGGTQKLARLVGTARALEMVLRGRTVTPKEAEALGMVHEVTDAGLVFQRAMEYAEDLCRKSPLAIRHIKELVRTATETPLNEGLARERTLFLDLLVSNDARRLMHDMNEGLRDIRDP